MKRIPKTLEFHWVRDQGVDMAINGVREERGSRERLEAHIVRHMGGPRPS